MILRAIKTGQMDFLYCVFAYNKNYEEIEENEDSDSFDSEAEDHRYKIFTLDFLFKRIIDYCED
jgi:hypothetical protein